jgi:hypothetical protein
VCSIRTIAIVAALGACVAREVELSSTDDASTVALQNFDFGSSPVGTATASHTFTISPTSGMSETDTVNSITEQCPDFVVTATGLPAAVKNTCNMMGSGVCMGGFTAMAYTFNATFDPTVLGPTSCPVTVTIDGVPSTLTLSGTGTVQPIVIAVSPATPPAAEFGGVRVTTTSSPLTVTIDDVGSSPSGMTVTSVAFDAASLANGYAIASGTTTSHTVIPGTDDVYAVTCTPPATGATTGTLTIQSNDPATPTSTVQFTCTGIMSNLVIDPSPATLHGSQSGGATRVGEPVDMTFTLTNAGDASLVLQSFAVTGTDLTITQAPADNTTLQAGGSASLTVHYAATKPMSVQTLGTLQIMVDDVTVQQRTATISGAAFETSMAINGPLNLGNFGPVCANAQATQMFSVVANDPASFAITQIESPSAPFAITAVVPPQLPSAGTPTAIQGNANSTATFSITVTPTEAGSATSTLTVDTDIPAGSSSQTITLAVLGLAPGVTASPAMVDLGTANVGATSAGGMVTLTNCGSAALTLQPPSILGADSGDFLVVLPPASTTLAAGASASYVVAMQAHADGTRQATLELDYTGGSATVELIGDGQGGGSDDTDTGEKSYYSCSSSGGGAGGGCMIALAALALGRRRRRR